MTQYYQYPVPISENQLEKIRTAFNTKQKATIQIDFKNKTYDLLLTQTQINKLKKGKGFRLHLSHTQLREMKKQHTTQGGIFPLLALLGLAAGIGTAGASIASAVQSKKANDKALAEARRHNLAKEKETAALRKQFGIITAKKGGSLLTWFNEMKKSLPNNKEVFADGLYLSRSGNGLYLRQAGNGLYLQN